MKRFNGKNGIPEMEENPQGHWISWHEHNLAMLEMSKSIERNWEASCSSGDKIKPERLPYPWRRVSAKIQP